MQLVHVRDEYKAQILVAGYIIAMPTLITLVRFLQAEHVPALMIAFARFSIASTVLFPFVIVNGDLKTLIHMPLRTTLINVVSGMLLAAQQFLVLYSLEFATVLVSRTFMNTSLIWVLLVEVAILGVKPGKLFYVGFVITLLGSLYIIIFGQQQSFYSSQPVLGGVLALGSAIALSGYVLISRQIRHSIPPILYLWLMSATAAVFGAIALAVTDTPVLGYSTNGYIFLVAVTFAGQLLGQGSLNLALRYVSAIFMSLVQQLVPVISALVTFFIFNEQPSTTQIVGSVITLAGVLIAIYKPIDRKD